MSDPAARTVEFFGETFALEVVGDFDLMEFAEAADRIDSESLAGMGACLRLLKAAISRGDWARFRKLARDRGATIEDCMKVVLVVFDLDEAARPTVRSSDSSDGPPLTEPSSTGASSSAVVRRLEAEGRPELALFVVEAIEARSAA